MTQCIADGIRGHQKCQVGRQQHQVGLTVVPDGSSVVTRWIIRRICDRSSVMPGGTTVLSGGTSVLPGGTSVLPGGTSVLPGGTSVTRCEHQCYQVCLTRWNISVAGWNISVTRWNINVTRWDTSVTRWDPKDEFSFNAFITNNKVLLYCICICYHVGHQYD